MATGALGADQYWYQIDVSSGNQTQTFYGSSKLDPAAIEVALHDSDAIELHDLSDNYAKPREDKMSWKRLPEEKTALLPAHSIVSIIELADDPVKLYATSK